MAKNQNKTVPNKLSPTKYLNAITQEQKRKDAKAISKMMAEITGEKPVMWGETIVGYGQYHYKYESGREGDMPKIGFSARKQSMTIYIMMGFDKLDNLIDKLGKCKTSKACLYFNKLSDVDDKILRTIIKKSYDHMSKKFG